MSPPVLVASLTRPVYGVVPGGSVRRSAQGVRGVAGPGTVEGWPGDELGLPPRASGRRGQPDLRDHGLAHERGDRVVEVLATDGALGVVPDGLDPAGLAAHRRAEHEHAAEVIGIDRIVRLGFADSGMTGWDSNRDPRAFCNADPGSVAERLVGVLREEDADVLVHYDPHGNYGHPDHLMVHRVGAAAADLLGPGLRVLEGTMNQNAIAERYARAKAMGIEDEGFWDPAAVGDDGRPIGSPQSQIRWAVDLPERVIATKHRALEAHASQASDVGVFLSLSSEVFAIMFGTEYYREPADPGPMRNAWPVPSRQPGALRD